jgi:hypothetical protein
VTKCVPKRLTLPFTQPDPVRAEAIERLLHILEAHFEEIRKALICSSDRIDLIGGAGGIKVRKNSGVLVGTRPQLNFIEGSNITLTVVDDGISDEIDLTINAAAAAVILPSATVVTETAFGQASTAGVSADYSRGDHTHGTMALPKLDDLAAPDDNTDTDATAAAHGLLPKLSGVATEFLAGDGSWITISTAGGMTHPQVMSRVSMGF